MKGKYFKYTILLVAAILLTSAILGCTPTAEAPAPPAEPGVAPEPDVEEPAAPVDTDAEVAMDFVTWSYGVESIADNIANFQNIYPNITITHNDYSWLEYRDIMIGVFAAGNPPYLLYGSDHWLDEWASAGWLEPLDEHCPNVAEYNLEVAPYALEGMTWQGQTFGLSYYADTMDFVYNAEFVEEAGFTAAPTTLDEVYEMSVAIKEQGINQYPIIMAWSQAEGAYPEAWLSLVYAQHVGDNAMFDDDLNPVFNSEGSAAYEVMEWLRMVYEEGLLDPASLTTAEIDQVRSMQAGAQTFTIVPQYNMAELNSPGSGDYAGSFEIALMPGPSHATVGYVRFYAMTPRVVEAGPEYVDAACKFMDYFGGKHEGEYVVVKRWAVENGLGFAQLPLFDDAEVIEAFGSWGDVPTIREQASLARAKEGMTDWYGSWDVFARAEIHKGILGELSTMEVLDNMANMWVELMQQYQ